MTIVWDNDNCLGQKQISWDSDNFLGQFINIFEDLCCSDIVNGKELGQ